MRHFCLCLLVLMALVFFSQSNVVVVQVECRALRSKVSGNGHRLIGSKPSFSSSATARKKRDKVFVRYQMSTLASGPSRKGSGH
ncbi:hypothetical protein ACE6H2_021198 [Prunus campanulata]